MEIKIESKDKKNDVALIYVVDEELGVSQYLSVPLSYTEDIYDLKSKIAKWNS